MEYLHILQYLGAACVCMTALSWLLCRLRLAPLLWMKIHFAIVFLFSMIALNWFGFFVDVILRRICGWPFSTKTGGTWRIVAASLHYIFRITMLLNPQIRVRPLTNAAQRILNDRHTFPQHSFLCSNHTSLIDGYILFSEAPSFVLRNMRSLYMKKLEEKPLWGAVYQRVGCYPVFFKKADEEGNFSVDKEKQAAVTARIESDMNNSEEVIHIGGFLEGALNKTPEKIQTVRKGSVDMCMKHSLPIYLVVNHGCAEAWPLSHAMGGVPCDIVYDVRVFDTTPHVKAGRKPEEVADLIRATMQEMMDAVMEAKGMTASSKKKDQ